MLQEQDIGRFRALSILRERTVLSFPTTPRFGCARHDVDQAVGRRSRGSTGFSAGFRV